MLQTWRHISLSREKGNLSQGGPLWVPVGLQQADQHGSLLLQRSRRSPPLQQGSLLLLRSRRSPRLQQGSPLSLRSPRS